jgi:hypothetical protein
MITPDDYTSIMATMAAREAVPDGPDPVGRLLRELCAEDPELLSDPVLQAALIELVQLRWSTVPSASPELLSLLDGPGRGRVTSGQVTQLGVTQLRMRRLRMRQLRLPRRRTVVAGLAAGALVLTTSSVAAANDRLPQPAQRLFGGVIDDLAPFRVQQSRPGVPGGSRSPALPSSPAPHQVPVRASGAAPSDESSPTNQPPASATDPAAGASIGDDFPAPTRWVNPEPTDSAGQGGERDTAEPSRSTDGPSSASRDEHPTRPTATSPTTRSATPSAEPSGSYRG